MIFRIEANNTVNRIYLEKNITENEYLEKYNKEGNLISYPSELVPNVSFLKYENGKIVEDLNAIKDFEFSIKKQESIQRLSDTDFLFLVDNPKNLTVEQLNIIKDYRQKLRDFNTPEDLYPEIPDFLINILY